MKGTKTQKGITLVALIITIIVLLILAVVAISAVSGDGILQHAKDATAKTKLAQAEEQAQLLLNEWKIEKHAHPEKTFSAFLNEKVNSGVIEELIDNHDGYYTLKINGQSVLVTENEVISQASTSATGGIQPQPPVMLK